MSETEWTTWDGLPISREAPFGTLIVVFRRGQQGVEFLLLHRAHNGVDSASLSTQHIAAYEGEWAWTPPSGARLPDEPVDECARRELLEETGLTLPMQATGRGQESWAVYFAEASTDQRVTLDAEHDRYEWVTLEVALVRCLPVQVGQGVETVARLLRLQGYI